MRTLPYWVHTNFVCVNVNSVYITCKLCVNVVIYIFTPEFLHLHLYYCRIYSYIHTHTITLTWFGVNIWRYVKCIYCIPLMTIPSCNSRLISCGCMFWRFFFCHGPFGWPIIKNIMKSPTFQVKVTFKKLFYTYIVFYGYVKPYKCIYFYTYENINEY
jgi:hypothetical protein